MNNHTEGGLLTVADVFARLADDADRNGWPAVERWEPREGYEGRRFKPSRVRVVLQAVPPPPVARFQLRPAADWHLAEAAAWRAFGQVLAALMVLVAMGIVLVLLSGCRPEDYYRPGVPPTPTTGPTPAPPLAGGLLGGGLGLSAQSVGGSARVAAWEVTS